RRAKRTTRRRASYPAWFAQAKHFDEADMRRNRPAKRAVPPMIFFLFLLVALLACGASPAPAADVDPLDWPNWRGPEQNGISREAGLVDHFDPDSGDNVLWANAELGGISTPIVLRGKLYTIVRSEPGTTREGEKVVCADAATGKKIWEVKSNVYLSDVPAERVGWANCVGDPATGHVYALGACGNFQCLDGETGKPLWRHSLNEEFGLLTTY